MKKQSQNYVALFVGALLLYLASTVISYFIFTTFGAKRSSVSVNDTNDVVAGDDFKVDESLPKTEECPLNGKLYTKPEKSIWEKRRPLAVMIENSVDSRPQSGLSKADIVYEAVAEGGITRFMPIFYCGLAEQTELAPVRSARIYFYRAMLEYNALYMHVGGAGVCSDSTVDPRAKVLCELESYGAKDLDHLHNSQYLGFPTCYQNPDRIGRKVATEHTMVCKSNKLFEAADKREILVADLNGSNWDKNYESWKFQDDADENDRGSVNKIELYWWPNQPKYKVMWDYDSANNRYNRSVGGEADIDLENDEQLFAKNVVVQFADETTSIDEHKHVLYDTVGAGNAILFQNGEAIEGTWKKKSETARTYFYDENGKEVKFVRGEIWIEIIPTGNDVTY